MNVSKSVLIKTNIQKQLKVTCLIGYVIEIDQSQISYSKIVSKGKMITAKSVTT